MCCMVAIATTLTTSPSITGVPTIVVTAPEYVITPNSLNVTCTVRSFPQSMVTVVVNATEQTTTPQMSFDDSHSVVLHETGDVVFTVEDYGSGTAAVRCDATIDRSGIAERHSSNMAFVEVYGEWFMK